MTAAFGMYSPLGHGVQDPEDPMEDCSKIFPLTATSPIAGDQVADQRELLVGQLVSTNLRHPGLLAEGPQQ